MGDFQNDDLAVEEGLPSDGLEDSMDDFDFFRRASERESEQGVANRFANDNANSIKSNIREFKNLLMNQVAGGSELGFAQDYCSSCHKCNDLCKRCDINTDLLEKSKQAAMQIGLILAVCGLCSLLYLIMLYLEKWYERIFNPEKDKDKPW